MDFSNKPILLVALLAVVASGILITISYMSSQLPATIQPDQTQTDTENTVASTSNEVEPANDTEIIFFEQPTKGDSNAPVTIVEFAEFYCPYCARHVWQTLPLIETEYIDTGLVKYEFRNLVVHGDISHSAASAGECANEQGKFWSFHDRLFEEIFAGRVLSQHTTLDVDALKAIAVEIGIELQPFEQCLNSPKNAEKITADRDKLTRLVAQLPQDEAHLANQLGTPTFFINGHVLIGAQPYDNFKHLIDEQLY